MLQSDKICISIYIYIYYICVCAFFFFIYSKYLCSIVLVQFVIINTS